MYRILVLCFGLLLLCLYVTMGQYMGPISLGACLGLSWAGSQGEAA